jgi:hypothetical protein
MERYYLLKGYKPPYEKVELTLEQYINLEKIAGFSGPGHYEDPPQPACRGFTTPTLKASVEWTPDNG